MTLLVNQPYRGLIENSKLMPNFRTKLYFASIYDRNKPEKYEWAAFGKEKQSLLEKGLENYFKSNSKHLKIPHVAVSFPHVTALYRWGNPRFEEQETNFYKIGLGQTPDLENIKFKDPEGTFSIGCPTELYVISQENLFRCDSTILSDYLNRFAPNLFHQER